VREAGGPRKIAAIGIRVSSQGISSHGFALNVDPCLAHFAGIVPCGIQEHGVTSIAAVLGRPIAVTEALEPVTAAFSAVFESPLAVAAPFSSAYNDQSH
jgi:lipoyl(octanoyl) transferase